MKQLSGCYDICETRLGVSEIEMEKSRLLEGYVDVHYARDLDQ